MPFLDGKPVIITKRNTDKYGNPVSVKQIETKQVVDIHNSIPLNYSIDRNHPIVISGMHQTYNKDRITENTFYADYDQGILYFHQSQVSKSLTITYMATGYILISSDRIYRYNKVDGISATESVEASFEKLENLLNTIIQNGGGCDQIVAEVVGSRTDAQGQTFPSLGDRLNHIDIQLDNLTAMVKYVRTETMQIDGNTVGVGINEYTPTKDILNVYLSGVKMIEGIDYSLDKDNRIITNLKGQWIIGDQIHFEVYQRMIDRNMLPDTPITSMNAQNVTVAPNVLGKDNVQDVLVDMELTLKQVPNKNDYVAKAGDTMTGNLVMDNNSKVVGDLEGNSDTTTKLKTARDIVVGNATKQFDGSGNIEYTLEETGVIGEIDTRIETIKIGARNLLRNTKKFDKLWIGSHGTLNVEENVKDDFNAFTLHRDNFVQGQSRAFLNQYFNESIDLFKKDRWVSISGYVYVDSSVQINNSSANEVFVRYYDTTGTLHDVAKVSYRDFDKDKWVYFEASGQITHDIDPNRNLDFILALSQNGFIKLMKPMVVIGNKIDQEWSPHPSDPSESAIKLNTPRTLTVGNTGKDFDGTQDLTWTLDEIGVSSINHTHNYAGSDTEGGVANSTKKLETPVNINGVVFDGTKDITIFDNTKETPANAQLKADQALDDAKKYTDDKVADLVNSAPDTLDTLKELADALGNDPNFATTVVTQIGQKADMVHNHSSSQVNAMTGYTKPNTTSAIVVGDTLNQAIGKLERALDDKQASGNYLPTTGGNMTGAINFNNNIGLSNAGRVYLRGSNNSTILSADAGGTIYFRPNGDGDTTGQVRINGNGDVFANTFSGALNGNATTSTRLQTARNIQIGNANKSFDGSQNVSWTLDEIGASPINHTHGSDAIGSLTGYNKGNHNGALTVNDTLNIALAKLENGIQNAAIGNFLPTVGGDMTGNINFATDNRGLSHLGRTYLRGSVNSTVLSCATGGQIYIRPNGDGNTNNQVVINNNGQVTASLFNGNLTGNANTSTRLQTTREIRLQGDVTGTANFNGSANAVITSTLANVARNNTTSNQSPNFGTTFTAIDSITTDTKGRITGVNTKTITLPNPAQANDTNVTNTLNTTTRAYITGTTSSTTNTGTQIFDNNVYLDTTAGYLTATQFNGRLNGNATTATRLQNARTIKIGNSTAKPFDGTTNLTFTLQEIGAAGGGGITSITTNGQTYNAVGNSITLPNHLLLTGGTVTGATTFQAGVTIGNTSRITEQAGGLNIFSPSITLGGGDIYIQNPMRFVGHGLEDNDGNWEITQGGIATFKGVNAHNDLVCSGTVAGKDGVGGANTWVIHRSGEAVFDSIKNKQLPSTWSIDSNGHSEFNNITARGVIYGKNRIALNNGSIYLPQGGGNTTCDHLRMGGGIMACKDDGTVHFLTSGGNPANLYGAGFIQGSDIKLKENIRYIDSPKKISKDVKDETVTKDELFNFIKNLKVCEYNYIESDNDKIGFIANDIVGDKVGDKIVLEDCGVLSYDTSNMLFAAIGALQEEIEKRENLEKENKDLLDRLSKIEKMLGI